MERDYSQEHVVIGTRWKLKDHRYRLDIGKKFFTVRLVRYWNMLLREVVGVLSLKVFKPRLDGPLSNLAQWKVSLSKAGLAAFNSKHSHFVSSVNFLSIPSTPASKSFMKMLKSTGPKMEPCGNSLVADNPFDVTPFTVTLYARSMSSSYQLNVALRLSIHYSKKTYGNIGKLFLKSYREENALIR
ncbi:hypothetical protein BTVI_67237 [Pitangus sulphuratus]|nr:hypothetical protein BTVI_67237 [Pitangus sulphuratus]